LQTQIKEKVLDDEYTSIRISKNTLDKLGKLGKFKQTWNDVIDNLANQKLGLSVPEEVRSW
jgi:hypothetical protein